MMTVRDLRSACKEIRKENPFSRAALSEIARQAHVRQQLQAELSKHLRSNEGLEKFVERIQHVAGVNQQRAKLIARTEKTRATNAGRFLEISEEYLREYDKAVRQHRKRPERPRIQWVEPMVAKEPRKEHIAISGKTVTIGEEFLPGLRFPGDPAAPVSQTANCHCYIRRAR